MHIFSKATLKRYWRTHPAARETLRAWFADVSAVTWRTPADLRRIYATVSILNNNRAVFNIKGNKYRVVVSINYERGWVYVRFVGTHAEYDKIDANKIQRSQ